MTPEAFQRWLDEMKANGLAKTDIECAEKLGIHKNTVTKIKRQGGTRVFALACRALLHRLEPYE